MRLLWKALPLLVLVAACSAAPTAGASIVRLKSYKTTDRDDSPVSAATVIVRSRHGERNRLGMKLRARAS